MKAQVLQNASEFGHERLRKAYQTSEINAGKQHRPPESQFMPVLTFFGSCTSPWGSYKQFKHSAHRAATPMQFIQ